MNSKRALGEKKIEDLAALVYRSADEAAGSLSDDERAAYRDAQHSVVEARRRAEAKEGLLRIR